PRSIAPFSAAASSHHNLCSADFITNIAESDFWYTQELNVFMPGSIWGGRRCHRERLINHVKEASMKRFWLAAAAALILTTMLPDGAFAQRGGFRGGGFGGGGFRGAAIGGGFRGAAIGGGFRGTGIGGGFRGTAIGGGFRGAAIGGG